MSDPSIKQKLKGDKNVFTGTGNIYIYNYYEPRPAVEQIADKDDSIHECPYRGLFAFGPEHANMFFGRENTVESLFATVQKRNFTVLIGPSGSGKSSVVLAGLAPKLHRTSQCLITHFRPADDPFRELARAMLHLYEPEFTKTDLLKESRKLAEDFRTRQISLMDLVPLIYEVHQKSQIFIIADQFEELFTLYRDTTNTNIYGFIDLLLSSITNQDCPIKFVVTIRADFFNQASLYRPLADAMQGANEILGPMTRPELMRAIEMPAQKLGVTFEDKLAARILDDVGDEAGNLPLLEFTLTELWRHQRKRVLTHHAYSEIGEVRGSLSSYADKVLQQLPTGDQVLARSIFIQLVVPGQGTEDTRRLATREELGEDKWRLVAEIATKRLITTNVRDTQDTAELIHEALIRSWQQLKTWLNEDRSFRIWQERLRSELKVWLDNNRADSALMRSFSLAEARYWRDNRPNDIAPHEKELIDSSLTMYRRQQQQRYLTAFASIAAVVVITILIIFSLALFVNP